MFINMLNTFRSGHFWNISWHRCWCNKNVPRKKRLYVPGNCITQSWVLRLRWMFRVGAARRTSIVLGAADVIETAHSASIRLATLGSRTAGQRLWHTNSEKWSLLRNNFLFYFCFICCFSCCFISGFIVCSIFVLYTTQKNNLGTVPTAFSLEWLRKPQSWPSPFPRMCLRFFGP